MLPRDDDEAPTSFESSASKRQKLGDSSYLPTPPSKNSASGEASTAASEPSNFHTVARNPIDMEPRMPPEFLGSSQNESAGRSGQDAPRSQFPNLPEGAALGVSDALLRKLSVSASRTSAGRPAITQTGSKHPNPSQQAGDDESLLASDGTFLSSQPASSSRPTHIDLTEEDDDDEVVCTGSRQRNNVQKPRQVDEICYGTMNRGTINSHRVPAFPPNHPQFPMLLRLVCSASLQSPLIKAYDYNSQEFGHVDVATSGALAPLMDLGIFRIQAYLYPLRAPAIPGTSVSGRYPFFLNVFGPEEEGRKAATLVSQKNFFFEKPHAGYHDGVQYKNPHHSSTSYLLPPKSRPQDFSFVSRTAEEIRSDVNTVFDGLDQAESLPEMEPSSEIKTRLLKHQKQGLYFLTSKEQQRTYNDDEKLNMSLWRKKDKNGQEYYYHVITGQQVKRRPPDVLGGILADMMGLGKTLQILSLIVTTQEDSCAFAKSPKPLPKAVQDNVPLPPVMNAKTTLLISPLSTISNWEEQIHAHVQEGTLKYHLYHGNKREADPKVLAEFDLLITTYQVIASEWSKHLKDRTGFFSPLQQIRFFRIVLDVSARFEKRLQSLSIDNDMYLGRAHIIREQNTLQSKAVIALHAERRWAVTGTPVQNRLDDLAALTKFIRLKPFDDKAIFNEYIAMPLKRGNTDSIMHLRLLVDSVTLRRQKDKIDLPPRKDLIVRLEFSPAEKEIYEATAKQSSRRVDMVAKQGRVGGKNYVHILQMILRLRLICAHGRELLGDGDTADLAGLTSSNAIDVEEIDETTSNLPPNQAYQIFSLMKETNEDVCALCEKKAAYKDPFVPADENSTAEDKGKDKEADSKDRSKAGTSIGFLTTCAHMLCKDCVPAYTSRISQQFQEGMRATCPICGLYGRIHLYELKTDELHSHLTGASNGKITKKKGFQYRGPSTKAKALLQALFQNRDEGSPDDPIKSVVFSCWTQHMDLIERAFTDKGIRFVRLDGSLSRTQRNAAIAQFRDDPTVEVILVSLMAGGLGVYVMEPQWNPAAEAQAIDRIHRLGQKKPVTTVRYIMAGSFEEKILQIQEKKNNLAKITMERGKKRTKEQQSQERIKVCCILPLIPQERR
ncbi:helicase-like protein [Sphaerosporella brunnea]|uniref:Helicase-like protein n=1 Tax=Sphaerosporella brunnea TaxID=1250544 RepID=A0A5J5EJM0_9PEZI|nr:helicase-like protein [Sphaerosporella brunnea]